MKKIYFIDFTTSITYDKITDNPIGGSEFQFYNLMHNISKHENIICYNKIEKEHIAENITYKNMNDIRNTTFNKNDIIVIQRLLPDINIIKTFDFCKIFLVLHDYDFHAVFFQFQNDKSNEGKRKFINYIVNKYNINFIFNSEFTQKYFNVNFGLNSMLIDKKRQHVIYNILYETYFSNNDNNDNNDNNNDNNNNGA